MVKGTLGTYSPGQAEHRKAGYREEVRVQKVGQEQEQVTAVSECCVLKKS